MTIKYTVNRRVYVHFSARKLYRLGNVVVNILTNLFRLCPVITLILMIVYFYGLYCVIVERRQLVIVSRGNPL